MSEGQRVLVCGGRHYSDRAKVYATLDALTPRPDIIIYGGAPGADTLARDWSRERYVASQLFTANWSKHGPAAGPIRNQQMLDDGIPELVVAFPGGRGTADMCQRAAKAGIPTIRVV